MRRRFRDASVVAIVGLLCVPAAGAGVFPTPSEFLGTAAADNGSSDPPHQPLSVARNAGCGFQEDCWARYQPCVDAAVSYWWAEDPGARHAVEELRAWQNTSWIARNLPGNDFVSIAQVSTEDAGGGVGLRFQW